MSANRELWGKGDFTRIATPWAEWRTRTDGTSIAATFLSVTVTCSYQGR